jgi:hypothetical protein
MSFRIGMPERPSIVILREAAAPFAGRVVVRVEGSSRLDIGRMPSRKLGQLIRAARDYSFDFYQMEDGVRAEPALAGACAHRVPALRPAPRVPCEPRHEQAPGGLLPPLPGSPPLTPVGCSWPAPDNRLGYDALCVGGTARRSGG